MSPISRVEGCAIMSVPPAICQLQIFTTPSQQITFYADDPTTYQQCLTIFNPCEFSVCFQIYLQASDNSRYSVNIPQGFIKPRYRVIIIIQHNSISASCVGVEDKLRITMSCKKAGVSFNTKELPMKLHNSRGQWDEHVSNPDVSEHLRYRLTSPHSSKQPSSSAKSVQSSKQCPPVPEPRQDPEPDIVKKLQGYFIAFVLGFIACYYWKS